MNKANQRIRDFLGLSQEQLAMLLLVSRSQLSLYELGLRKLPATALQQLAEMLTVIQTSDASMLMKSRAAEDASQHQLTLQKLLRENNFQQKQLEHKIVVLEQKYQANLTRLQLVQHLVSKGEFKLPFQILLLNRLENKITKSLKIDNGSLLAQYQIKLKVLQYEEKVLQGELYNSK